MACERLVQAHPFIELLCTSYACLVTEVLCYTAHISALMVMEKWIWLVGCEALAIITE